MKIGKSKFCFLTAHLAAHQNQMDRRTEEFSRISIDPFKAELIFVNNGSDDNTQKEIDQIIKDNKKKQRFITNCRNMCSLSSILLHREESNSTEKSRNSCVFYRLRQQFNIYILYIIEKKQFQKLVIQYICVCIVSATSFKNIIVM